MFIGYAFYSTLCNSCNFWNLILGWSVFNCTSYVLSNAKHVRSVSLEILLIVQMFWLWQALGWLHYSQSWWLPAQQDSGRLKEAAISVTSDSRRVCVYSIIITLADTELDIYKHHGVCAEISPSWLCFYALRFIIMCALLLLTGLRSVLNQSQDHSHYKPLETNYNILHVQ